MLSRAIGKYIRISPSKTRLVMNLVKGKTVEEAGYILDSTNKNVCQPIKKVLDSAFANANFNRQDKFLLKDLFVSNIKADVGPMLQRYRAASMGRATPIRHRTAHISIELDKVVKVEPKKKETPAKKEASPNKKTAAKKEGK